MIKYALCETQSDPTIPVVFSSKIENKIHSIFECNQENQQALSNWNNHINWIKEYISKFAVAFDYGNNHRKFPNGTRYIPMLDAAYTVKNNSYGAYVYVFLLKVKPQKYGLKVPQDFKEDRIYAHLSRLVKETVRRTLMEHLKKESKRSKRTCFYS